MFLYRRKVLLALLANAPAALSLVQLQKIMFLFVQKSGNACYDFIPDTYGCYSMTLHDDIHNLEKNNFVMVTHGNDIFSTTVTIKKENYDDEEYLLTKEDGRAMRLVLESYPINDVRKLIEMTYKLKPFYAIRSGIVKDCDDRELEKSIVKCKEMIETGHPRCLYTIGYQGFSVDAFARTLMMYNIKTLVDVRKNAFSMRREFCGSPLMESLKEAGILYVAMPEVGIPSKDRKEMIPAGKLQELFAWYKENVLPGCASYAKRIADYVKQGSTAVMCYEELPKDCHRKLFAEYCLAKEPSIGQVRHIPRPGLMHEKKSSDNGAYLSPAID